MTHPLVQVLFLALLVFSLMRFVVRNPLGWWIIVVVTIGAALGAAVVFLHRYDPPGLGRAYRVPGLKQFIDLVCRLGGLQPPQTEADDPVPGARSASTEARPDAEREDRMVLLHRPGDFDRARAQLAEVVRGHDEAISRIFTHLARAVLLRQKQERKTQLPPLGRFLLVGDTGIGKRHLAMGIGQLLFRGGGFIAIDFSDHGDEASASAALFGQPTSGGGHVPSLLSEVKARPYQMIVLERVDRLSGRPLERLTRLMATGSCLDEETGTRVSVQNCVFCCTTTLASDLLGVVRARAASDDEWRRSATEALIGATSLDEPFLSQMNDLLHLSPPDDLTKAEVVCLAMEREA
ncbi:MAG: hypothetical protein KDA25_00025, partial [Phycisphaerales bacterium]|nr:hypothetical protein [Phycisphaerales bacterium]